MRWQQQADRQGAILLAALHDIAGLNEYCFCAVIFDGQLVDVTGLVDPHSVIRHRLLERQRRRPVARISKNEIDSEIFAHRRPGEAVLALAIRRPGSARVRCDE
jgi:hypothetical protein